MKLPHQMRLGNRYARETGAGRTLGELMHVKMALVAVCRRCKHRRVLYPANFIPRFGETYPAIELRHRLRCSGCRGRMATAADIARVGRPLLCGVPIQPPLRVVVANVAGGKPLPEEASNQILQRTDGVPLFIEELTKMVLESGLLREGDHGCELSGPLPSRGIPLTLHASLLARLDRLASAKEAAQIGAAIGREFSYALASAVATLPEKDFKAALGQLVAAELIFQRGAPPDASYQFKHSLVRDAAYASPVRSRRQQLHGKIAHALEVPRRGGSVELGFGV